MAVAQIMYLYLTHAPASPQKARMTVDEKAEAFDLLCTALTNRWESGHWTWWCANPAGGPARDNRDDCIRDLIEWAERCVKWRSRQQQGAK